ncbi:proteasome assembly chaperone 4 isoform X1 [Narcine bancroftii]|uniref:proteasome assembly chaperone 4 isoform X1 n=1 Tax=Narcine bancroftii TaxID=1343680 RepID=UPI003831010D
MSAVGAGTLSVYDFSEKLAGQSVYFHVLRMSGSFFLWVGTAPTLSNLAVAMSTRFDPTPVSTLILGDASDTTPSSIAQRLGHNCGDIFNCVMCCTQLLVPHNNSHKLLRYHLLYWLHMRRRPGSRCSSAITCPTPTPACH